MLNMKSDCNLFNMRPSAAIPRGWGVKARVELYPFCQYYFGAVCACFLALSAISGLLEPHLVQNHTSSSHMRLWTVQTCRKLMSTHPACSLLPTP